VTCMIYSIMTDCNWGLLLFSGTWKGYWQPKESRWYWCATVGTGALGISFSIWCGTSSC